MPYDVSVELRVLGSADSGDGAIRSTVQVQVQGLPGTTPTRLTISLGDSVQALQLPSYCTGIAAINAACQVTNGPLEFHVVHLSTVTIHVDVDALTGHPDPDPANNAATVPVLNQ